MLQKFRSLILFELGEKYVKFLASAFHIFGEKNYSIRVFRMAKLVEQK